MAVRRYSGPKMRSSRQGDGAGSGESEQMTTPTLTRRPITTESIVSAATHPSLRGALATKQSRGHNMRGASNPDGRTAAPGLLCFARNDGTGIGSFVSACRLSTNANLVSPPHACRKAGNDYRCTRRKWSAISFRGLRTASGEHPFAFSARVRIPVRKRQIFINATLPWVIVEASADQNETTAHVQFRCEARPLRVALARSAKINNGQNKKSSRKGVET
jgi:hypothetical protein